MNILRLSTLSLALVMTVMTLGYVNPSFAGKPVDGKHDHGDGKDKTETVFLVQMVQGDVPDGTPGLVTTKSACGSTEGELHLGAVFIFPPVGDDGCADIDVCFMSGPTGCPLTLHVWYVQVNLNKSYVKILFRAHNENNLFVTDHLPVTIIGDGPPSAFTVVVNEDGLIVERNHNPGKGDLVGPIAIGEIVFTPD